MFTRVGMIARQARVLPRVGAFSLQQVPTAGLKTFTPITVTFKQQAKKQCQTRTSHTMIRRRCRFVCRSSNPHSLHVLISVLLIVPLFTARTLHTSPTTSSSESPKKNPFSDISADPTKLVQLTNECINKLQTASTQQLFHWSAYGLAGLTPVALILSPSFLNFPVDFALGLIIPVHMHIGLIGVIEDYIPRPTQSLARFVLAILTLLSGIGLLKINLCGAGITESVKSIWREPKEEKKTKRIKQ